MTELKTLKDLEEITYKRLRKEKSMSLTWQDMEKTIRQEAINWIKELEDNTYEERIEQFVEVYHDGRKYASHVINWISHFFNITEEDLK